MKKVRGFTLMETLIAMTLFALVASSSYVIFSMGIQIWKRTQGGGVAERKAVLALEKMARDMRIAVKTKPKSKLTFDMKSTQFDFEGTSTSFTLPAMVTFFTKEQKNVVQYGRVGYQWNAGTKELCRTVESLTDLYREKKPECQPLVPSVQRVRFRYWLYDGVGDSYSWYDSWEAADRGLPQTVEILLELAPPDKSRVAAKKGVYQRTVLIPVGGKP